MTNIMTKTVRTETGSIPQPDISNSDIGQFTSRFVDQPLYHNPVCSEPGSDHIAVLVSSASNRSATASSTAFFLGISSRNYTGHHGEVLSHELKQWAKNFAGQKYLDDALAQLAELDDYAEAGEHSPPAEPAKESVKYFLEIFAREVPRDYMVSLWEDGDVIIYSSGAGWRVDIYCRANGGVSFYVNPPDKRGYESHYHATRDRPVGDIISALKKIPA